MSAPTRRRQAGRAQGGLLAAISCLPVLGSTLIAPVQPAILRAFPDQAGAAALVPVMLTLPALIIGLTALASGRVIDRLGRRRVLLTALLAYAVFGTAPLWLPTLPLILVSRIGVGFAEAAIFTCATTLLGDYFTGAARTRYIGVQQFTLALSAVVFLALGGALGAGHWRLPFVVYFVALPLAGLAVLFLWQPIHAEGRSPRLNWSGILRPCLFTLIGGIIFYTPVVQLSFRLDAIGVTSAAVIGVGSALAAAVQAVPAGLFPKVARFGPRTLLPVAFGLLAAGLVVMAVGQQAATVVGGAIVANAGGGLMVVTLLHWTVGRLDVADRARGTGAWTAAFFVGQFLCPLVVFGLGGVLGGLSAALFAMAITAVLVAVAARRR